MVGSDGRIVSDSRLFNFNGLQWLSDVLNDVFKDLEASNVTPKRAVSTSPAVTSPYYASPPVVSPSPSFYTPTFADNAEGWWPKVADSLLSSQSS